MRQAYHKAPCDATPNRLFFEISLSHFQSAKLLQVYLFFKKNNLVVNKQIRDFLVYDGFYFANYLLDSEIQKYSDFKEKMTNKFGEKISPFIRNFYEYLRFYPGIDSSGMTRSDEIDRYYFEKLGE